MTPDRQKVIDAVLISDLLEWKRPDREMQLTLSGGNWLRGERYFRADSP